MRGILQRGVIPSLVLVLLATSAWAYDDANRSGVVNGHTWSSTDSNGDGLPESITIDGFTISNIQPGSQFDVNGVRVCVGTNGPDIINESGEQIPCLMFGGPGDDLLFGGEQEDFIHGSTGNDDLAGNNGNDRIEGGSDNDRISGGEGNDDLTGGPGDDDPINGDAGDDIIEPGDGNDVANGGDGDDVLIGIGDGADTYNGDGGADTFTLPDGETNDNYNYGANDGANDTGNVTAGNPPDGVTGTTPGDQTNYN